MSSYSELIKNFEKIRAYMRDFYVYGFKSREGYTAKSARSYDDERRRLESWLGEHMSLVRTPDGKQVFLSIDSRTSEHNPLYKAWKAKSFTDGDITLHFILFDILHTPGIRLSAAEILRRMDEEYLASFDRPMVFDESTVRKKLKEYVQAGLICTEKQGRSILYRRAEDSAALPETALLDFYSEAAPCGVIGSFLLDRCGQSPSAFGFKHHYITGALDSDVLAALFHAMREKSAVTVSGVSRRSSEPRRSRIVPLRIFISVQSGRQHLLAYHPASNCIKSFRVDYLSHVKLEEPTPRFDELRARLNDMQTKMWGVSVRGSHSGEETEHVEFVIRAAPDEGYIVNRLEREKRIGCVEKLDEEHYRFSADVYDTTEMIPWIRTFICRIEQLHFSNRTAEKQFREDLREMYRMYGVEGGGEA